MEKKIFYCFTALLFFLSGCKKEAPGNESSNAVSFNIDGKPNTFNHEVSAVYHQSQNGSELRIVANEKQGSQTAIDITITSPDPITAGTYTENSAAGIGVHLVYYIDEVIRVNAHDSWGDNFGRPRTGTVRITEINGSHVKGTFYGVLYYYGILGNFGINTLANGVFDVNF